MRWIGDQKGKQEEEMGCRIQWRKNGTNKRAVTRCRR